MPTPGLTPSLSPQIHLEATGSLLSPDLTMPRPQPCPSPQNCLTTWTRNHNKVLLYPKLCIPYMLQAGRSKDDFSLGERCSPPPHGGHTNPGTSHPSPLPLCTEVPSPPTTAIQAPSTTQAAGEKPALSADPALLPCPGCKHRAVPQHGPCSAVLASRQPPI